MGPVTRLVMGPVTGLVMGPVTGRMQRGPRGAVARQTGRGTPLSRHGAARQVTAPALEAAVSPRVSARHERRDLLRVSRQVTAPALEEGNKRRAPTRAAAAAPLLVLRKPTRRPLYPHRLRARLRARAGLVHPSRDWACRLSCSRDLPAAQSPTTAPAVARVATPRQVPTSRPALPTPAPV